MNEIAPQFWVIGQIVRIERIYGDEENRNLFFVNNGSNIFTIKCLSDIHLLHTINDLNLVDHLKAFKCRKV
jgi:hypothetical protein